MNIRSVLNLAAILLVVALSGCAVSESVVETDSEEITEADSGEVVTTTPSPEVNQGFTGANSITDENGYEFSVELQLVFGELQKNVTDDKPGFSSALIPIEGTGLTITNETAGRAAPAPFGTANDYYAIYSSGSPVCAIDTALVANATHCAIYIATSGSTATAPLELDSGQELTQPLSPREFAFNYSTIPSTIRVPSIPDADWDATVAALQEPIAIVASFNLMFLNGPYKTSLCPINDATAQSIFAGNLVVVSSDGFDVCAA
jgi:hypothetical protein